MRHRATTTHLFSLIALASFAPAQDWDYAAAAAYHEQLGGHALMITIDGKVVFERYSNGYSSSQGHVLHSCTKSITSVLCAFAVQDKLIASYDEKVSDTITEWQVDARRKVITYRQLLGLVSGIAGGENGQPPTYKDSIKQVMFADPGTAFSYGPYPFQIFGEALRRKLVPSKRSVADYLTAKILVPLNMTPSAWINFATGEPNLPSGAQFTASEWIKFGEFVRLGGMWNNQRLLSQSLLDELFQNNISNKPDYGVSWWLTLPDGVAPDDTVAARGAQSQRLWVIRSERMVILRFADSPVWTFDHGDDGFFAALMPAAVAKIGDGCKGAGGVPSLVAVTPPKIGTTFEWRIGNLPATPTLGITYVGLSNTSWGTVALPLDLSFLGAPGCRLFVSTDFALPWAGASSVTQRLPVPNSNTLSVHRFYMQSAVVDGTANTLAMTLSDAGVVRVGVR
ncbi:MAG: beta-lactamase family protein [Planctomycetes bacterium]|nr:beta-lactamase family protein [Planctomycetota bacterium]MCB9869176.1 beta-lactamase family protein [Planctomycetota bacterium]MCB9888989.1 beta-lactamase family protein [Planctomycetota bacterium]